MHCTMPRATPNINYPLSRIMTCASGFPSCNKRATLVGVLVVGGAEWGKGVWGNFVLSAQFCCEPKITLKNKVSFFLIIRGKVFKNKLILQVRWENTHMPTIKGRAHEWQTTGNATGREVQRPACAGPFPAFLGLSGVCVLAPAF